MSSMKDLRIEITDAGTGLYVAVDPDGVPAKTTRPDELITVDWDAQGRVIGVEVIGSPARAAVVALARSLMDFGPVNDPSGVQEAVQAILSPNELAAASPHSRDPIAATPVAEAQAPAIAQR
jgi:YD repeat-containing protein